MPDSTSTGSSPRTPRRAAFAPRPLAQTQGPDVNAPLDEVRLTIGVIVGAHGVDGEMKVRLTTDDPDHLTTIRRIYLGDDPTPVKHGGVRFNKGMALIKVPGVTTLDAVRAIVGTPVRISGRDARPLEANEYYLYQVVGIAVHNEAGEPVGTVVDVLETGANAVFVVRPPDGTADLLLPSIPDVVIDLRPADGVMVIRPLTYYGE